jgi:hypothetical protein
MVSPGVKTRELDFSMYASAISTCVVGMVGGASKGPIGIPTFCTNPTEFARIFGEPIDEDDYGAISAMLFLEKGSALWYVREDNGDADFATIVFDGTEDPVLDPGEIQIETLTVVGTVTADPGGDLDVTVTCAGLAGFPKTYTFGILKDDTAGQVATYIRYQLELDATLTALWDVGGTGADVTLTAKSALADVPSLQMEILANAHGVTPATSVNTQVGVAPSTTATPVTGIFTITYYEKGTYGEQYSAKISDVSGLDFTLTLYKANTVIETFATSLDELSTKYIGNKTVDGFTFTVDIQTATIVNAVAKTALSGGDNGLPLLASDVIGVGSRGLNALANPNTIDISVIAAPGRTEATVIAKMLEICESRADCFAIIDPPIGLTVTDVLKFHNGTLGGLTDPTSALDNSFGAMYYPWTKVVNPTTAVSEWVPPSAVVLGALAVNDDLANPWFAPAGLTRGRVNQVISVERDLTEADMDLLYGSDNAINPIINYRRQGFVIWGQRTLQREDTALDRVNVRRMMLYIRKIVATSSAFVVFEQNDVSTWSTWTNMITPFLENVKNGRGLYEYQIQMDASTVTDAHIDRNEMPGKILVRPTKTAEFIVIDFVLKSTGASFS